MGFALEYYDLSPGEVLTCYALVLPKNPVCAGKSL